LGRLSTTPEPEMVAGLFFLSSEKKMLQEERIESKKEKGLIEMRNFRV